MSTTIDQRVVEMRLDNKQFEANAQASISTLSKLRQSLNLTGASKGLENISAAAKNNNMGVLGSAVESVGLKFNAMQVMGTTALVNLTNSAYQAGSRIVQALTIDPVKTGFQEYELKMDAVRVIMSSTGKSLDEVNAKLAELNEYSDKTIYSFSDMTQNIGKFTNANVELDDAVMAMKGISNAAALAGANSNEASRAMYNLAQSISMGYVQYIDWKSIENANMATFELKNYLLDTAIALGTVKKAGDDTYKTLNGDTYSAMQMFKDGMKDQWLTTEVLMSTLKDFGDETTEIGKKATEAATKVNTFSKMLDTLKESAQSGWAQSWEIIFGDYEEGVNLWTKMSEAIGGVINKMSDARNEFLTNVFSSPWERLTKEINKAGVETDDFKKKLFATASEHNSSLKKMKYSEENFNKALEDGIFTKDIIVETLGKMISGNEGVGESTEELQKKYEKFHKVVSEVWRGDFKNGEERVKLLTEAGYDYAEVQALVNKTENDRKLDLEDLSDAELKAIGYTKEEIEALRKLEEQAKKTGTPLNKLIEDLTRPSGRELIGDIFKNLGEELGKITKAIGEAWDEVFGDVNASEGLYGIIESLKKLTDEFTITKEQAESFKNIVSGAFTGIQLGWTVASAGVTAGIKILQAVLGLFGTDLVTLAGKIGEKITEFGKWAKENTVWWGYIDHIAKIIHALLSGIYDCIKAFLGLEVIGDVINSVIGWFSKLFGGIDFSGAANHIEGFVKVITGWFDKLEKKIEKINKLEINISWDSFNKFLDFLSAKIPGFEEFVENIRNLVKEISKVFAFDLSKFEGSLIAGIKNTFTLDLPDFEGTGEDIVGGLISGIKNGHNDAIAAIKNLGTIIKEAFCILLGIESPSKVFIALGGFIVAGLIYGLENSASLVGKSISSIVTNALNLIGDLLQKGLPILIDTVKSLAINMTTALKDMEIDFGALFVAGTLVAVAFFLNKILKLLDRLAKPLDGVKNIMDSVDSLLKQFEKTAKARQMVMYADALKSLAVAVAILVGSLMVLTRFNIKEDWPALVILAGLIGALIGLAAIAQKVEPEAFAKLAIFAIAISTGLWIMASAIKKIASIGDMNKAFLAVIDLGLLIGAIVGLLYVYGTFVKGKAAQNVDKAGILIAKIGLSLLAIATAMKIVSSLSGDDITKGLIVVGGVAVIFAGIIAISGIAGKHADKAGQMLLKMSVAIGILAIAMKLIATLSDEDINKGIVVISGITALFIAIIAISGMAKEHADKAGQMLLKMSVAIGVLAIAMKLIATLSGEDINKGIVVISGITALFIAIIAISEMTGEHADKAGSMFLKMAAGIGILAITLRLIAGISDDDLKRGFKVIAGFEAMFAVLIVVSKLGGPNADKAGDMIKKMSISILILVAAIAILSLIKPEKLAAATAAIASLMLCFAVLIGVTKLAKNTKQMHKTLTQMLIIVGVLAALIAGLSLLDPQSVIASSAALSILLLSLSVSLMTLGKTGRISTTVTKTLPTLLLVVGGLAAILGILAYFDVEPSIKTSVALITLLAGMTAVIYALSFVKKVSKSAIDALTTLTFIVGGLAAILGILAYFDVEPSIKTSVALIVLLAGMTAVTIALSYIKAVSPASIGALALLGLVIGELAIILGLLTYFNVEPSIGTSAALVILLTGMTVVCYMMSGLAGVAGLAATGVIAFGVLIAELAVVLAALGGLAQIPGLTWLIEEGGYFLQTIGTAIGQFIGGIAAGIAVAAVSTLPQIGIILSSFMTNIQPFLNGIKGIDPSMMEGAKALAETILLLTAANILEGLSRLITGGSSLTGFGEEIASLGTSLNTFATNLGTFTEAQVATVTCAADAIKVLAEAANALPKEGGWAQKLFGENSLGTFVTELPKLGTALNGFVTNLGTFNEDQVATVTCAADAIKAMADAASGIDGQAEWSKKLFGDNGLAAFGTEIESVGTNLKNFVTNLGTFTEAQVSTVKSAVSAIKAFASLANSDLKGAKKNLPGFSDCLPGLATDLTTFVTSMPTSDSIDPAVANIKKIVTMVGDLASAKLTSITEFTNGLGTMGKAGVEAFVTAFTSSSAKTDVKTAGGELINQAVEGAKSKKDAFKTAAETVAKAGASGAKSETIYTSFYNAGTYLGDGLTAGIADQYDDAYNAGYKLGQKAVQGEKDGQASNSPSKLTRKAGHWLGEGLIIGIKEMTKKVYAAGEDLGTGATNSMTSVVSRILDTINTDVDMNPTIRPVLDLSDVSAGANKLSSMLNMNSAFGVSADVGTISTMMNHMNQNGGNDDVVSAIDKLRNTLNGFSGDTYNVNGINYNDGTDVSDAIKTLVRAAKIERRT